MLFDLGYVDVRGLHNNHSTNINQAPPQSPGADYNTARPLYSEYPQLGDIPISQSIAASWYDALTARFAANIGKSVFINAGYAWGRNFANGNNLDQSNVNQYYGPTQGGYCAHLQFPIARRTTGRPRQEIPEQFQPRGGCSSWRVGILGPGTCSQWDAFHRHGQRYNLSQQWANESSRPHWEWSAEPSHRRSVVRHQRVHHPHKSADVRHVRGRIPCMPMGSSNWTPLFPRTFHITERQSIEFRADAFNTFNHPNFYAPDSNVGDSAEGQVTSTAIDNRRLQGSLRYSF